jgi:hypothetical protein
LTSSSRSAISRRVPLSVVFAAALILVLFLKTMLAYLLDLYSDEIFYWLASTRPALAYSDLPFMTALWAGAGSRLFGHSPLAVRSVFLLAGTAVPFLIYWVARPLVPRKEALEAAALALCLPLGGFLGLLAVPDVPLVFFGVLLAGLFERATRTCHSFFWVSAGIVAAFGMATHYRFGLFPLAMLFYLLITPSQRIHFHRPWPWVAATIAMVGLVPAIVFNLNTDLSGLGYHLVDRHPWEFQASGLLHVFKQAGLVTPPLYIALILTLGSLIRKGAAGDDRRALMACLAVVPLGIFLVLAPWADSTRTSIHWPLSGYMPLLVYLPQTLRHTTYWLTKRMDLVKARRIVVMVPAIGFAGTLTAFAGMGSQAFNEMLRPLTGPGVLSTKMAGWRESMTYLDSWLADERDDALLITDNYYTAAQLQFALGNVAPIFTIDNDKAIRDGRSVQFRLWERDALALAREQISSAVFISEDSTLSLDARLDVISRACALLPGLEFADQFSFLGGDRQFSLYRTSRHNEASDSPHLCPLPSQAWLDLPAADSELSGFVDISGWAFNEGGGIEQINLLIDGMTVMELPRNTERSDVVGVFSVENDPAGDILGFRAQLDTRLLTDGIHTFVLEVISSQGQWQHFRGTRVRIRNN